MDEESHVFEPLLSPVSSDFLGSGVAVTPASINAGGDGLHTSRGRIVRKKVFTQRKLLSTLSGVWTMVFVIVLYATAFLPLCDVFFRCGCRPLWKGGSSDCNVHSDAGPQCPQCAAPPSVGWIPLYGGALLTLASTLAFSRLCLGSGYPIQTIHGRRRAGSRSPTPFSTIAHVKTWIFPPLVAVVCFLVYGLIIASIFYLTADYPYFLSGPDHHKERTPPYAHSSRPQ